MLNSSNHIIYKKILMHHINKGFFHIILISAKFSFTARSIVRSFDKSA